MFTEEEKKYIQRSCFNVSILGSSVAELESQNGDWWMIIEQDALLTKEQLNTGKKPARSYMLMHRHANASGYHHQCACLQVFDAVLEILCHDDYRLKHRGVTEADRLLEELRTC